jgi:hypothetical protein
MRDLYKLFKRIGIKKKGEAQQRDKSLQMLSLD